MPCTCLLYPEQQSPLGVGNTQKQLVTASSSPGAVLLQRVKQQ